MSRYGGWAGKILRVNLSNGDIWEQDTLEYKDFIGGMGIGYKIMWDEVKEGVKAFDPENKIVVGCGPFSGTGIPASSRTNITSLLPTTEKHLISDSHMGGHFAAEMKYAGWDMIVLEGKAESPVWLRIEDNKVTIEDASRIWGMGIFEATAAVNSIMGREAHVACIGPAGENMVPMSVIMTGTSHSAGGHGGVFGSKNVKAIGVKGTGSVWIAGSRQDWKELDQLTMAVIGSNNQHVVPSTPQPWAEYHHPRSRWTGRPGLFWGAADPPVETGECDPEDINSVGFRCHKAVFDHGPVAENYTVRMGGCQSCPIRCHNQLRVPQLEQYGYSQHVANTCVGWFSPGGFMIKGFYESEVQGEAAMVTRSLGAQVADDLGVWCNYMQIGRIFRFGYENGIFKEVLSEEEYNDIPWDKMESGDPSFLIDIYHRIAYKQGEISHIGDGTYWAATRWNFGDDFWHTEPYAVWSPLGFPRHHAHETAAQVGALINCMFNRDAQCHTHINFTGSGLPTDLQREIAEELWGIDALDGPQNYTPMNRSKARFAKHSIIRNLLHDSLTLCNWMWPMQVSPLKSRNYRGDTTLEAKYFSVVTGVEKTEEELDLDGERMFTLHRAMTVRQMGTMDMRNEHDVIMDWVYDMDPDKEAFTPGTIKMDREDMQLALTMFYEEMGWCPTTGAPTRATLEGLGLKEVADELEEKGLLPA